MGSSNIMHYVSREFGLIASDGNKLYIHCDKKTAWALGVGFVGAVIITVALVALTHYSLHGTYRQASLILLTGGTVITLVSLIFALIFYRNQHKVYDKCINELHEAENKAL